MKAKSILFLLHSDSRSGAPKVILDLISFLNKNKESQIKIDIVINEYTGELFNEFKEVSCNVYYFENYISKLSRLKNFIKRRPNNLLDLIKKNHYNIAYGNSILSLNHLDNIKKKYPNIKTILHVHESEYLCDVFLDREIAIENLKGVDKIIAVSNFTKNNLIDSYFVPPNKVEVIYPYIKLNELSYEDDKELKDKYNKSFIITNIGTPNLTKGTDLIPQIAYNLKKIIPNLKFKILIIGLKDNNKFIKAIKLDIKKLKLENEIELIYHVPDPNNYLKISNLYIIPSREDSFSLMGIYARQFNIPIISFKNNGGLNEIYNDSDFIEANYLDTIDFAYKIKDFFLKKQIHKLDDKMNYFTEQSLKKNLEILLSFL